MAVDILAPSAKTFGDLRRLGLELRVICQKCGKQRTVDGSVVDLRHRAVAGKRFQCVFVRPDGKPCRGVGLPTIGKERRWTEQVAQHARQLKDS